MRLTVWTAISGTAAIIMIIVGLGLFFPDAPPSCDGCRDGTSFAVIGEAAAAEAGLYLLILGAVVALFTLLSMLGGRPPAQPTPPSPPALPRAVARSSTHVAVRSEE